MIKCAIIGLGQIGFSYDYNITNKNIILTHSKSIVNHRKFLLVAAVEKNKTKINRFKKKYSKPVYSSLKELFKYEEIDLVVISTETKKHFFFYKQLIKYKIKLIILEKPITHSIKYSDEILKLSRKNNISTYVNYQRSFEPGFETLRKNFIKGKYGKIEKAIFLYKKDLKENGCHAIDLILFLFGKPNNFSLISKGNKNDVLFKYKTYDIYLLNNSLEEFSIQIITDKFIIIFKDYNDIEIYEKKNLKTKKSKIIKTFSNSNIQFLYNYIYKNLKNKNNNINDNLVLSNYNHKIINKLHNEK